MGMFHRWRRMHDRYRADLASRTALWDSYVDGKRPLLPQGMPPDGKSADVTLIQAVAALLAATAIGSGVDWAVDGILLWLLAPRSTEHDWYPDFIGVVAFFAGIIIATFFLLWLLARKMRCDSGET